MSFPEALVEFAYSKIPDVKYDLRWNAKKQVYYLLVYHGGKLYRTADVLWEWLKDLKYTAVIQALHNLTELDLKAGEQDWRPTETIPEDYYA